MTADHITLVRNPDYNWAPGFVHQGPVNLEELTFRILPEAATRVTAFETGEVLMAGDPPALDAQSIADSGKATIQSFALPGVPAILMINTTKAPTDDINVRKAFAYCFNMKAYIDSVFYSVD